MATTKALRSLPLVQVEVLASSREEMALRDANVTVLCKLVLEWIHRNWEPAQLNVDQLTAKVLQEQTFNLDRVAVSQHHFSIHFLILFRCF